MSTPISKEVAEKDINGWIEKMQIRPRVREEKQKEIKELISACMYGEIRVNDDGNIVQVLSIAVGNLKELVFENRISLEDISVKTKNVGSDPFSVIAAYLSASTGVPMGVLSKIDNSDMALSGTIVGFF